METKQTDLIDFDKEFKEELKPTNADMNNKITVGIDEEPNKPRTRNYFWCCRV